MDSEKKDAEANMLKFHHCSWVGFDVNSQIEDSLGETYKRNCSQKLLAQQTKAKNVKRSNSSSLTKLTIYNEVCENQTKNHEQFPLSMKVDSLLVLPPQDSKVLKKVGCVSLIRIPSGSLLLLVSEYVPQGDGRRPGVAVQGLKCITYGGGVCELSLTVPVITANAESMRHDAVSRQEKSTKMLNISNFFQRTRLCVTWENSGQRCNNELCVFVLKPTGSSLPWQRLSLSLFC